MKRKFRPVKAKAVRKRPSRTPEIRRGKENLRRKIEEST